MYNLCLECSKTSLMFIKLLKMPRNLRNWECVAVVHWLFHRSVAPKGAVCVFKCLSANLALQEFFQAINFCFTRTTKHQHTRNLSLFFTTFMANLSTALSGLVLHEVFRLLRVSKHLYTHGIPEQLSWKAQTPPKI